MSIPLLVGICAVLLLILFIISFFTPSANTQTKSARGLGGVYKGPSGEPSAEIEEIVGPTEQNVIDQATEICNSNSNCIGFDTYKIDDQTYGAQIINSQKNQCQQTGTSMMYGKKPNDLNDLCKEFHYFNGSSLNGTRQNLIYTINWNSKLKQEKVTVDSKDVSLVKRVPIGMYVNSACYGGEDSSYNTIVDNMNNKKLINNKACPEDDFVILGPDSVEYVNRCNIGKENEEIDNITNELSKEEKLEGWAADETNNVLGATLFSKDSSCMALNYPSYVKAVQAVLKTFQDNVPEFGNTTQLSFSIRKNGDDVDAFGAPIWNSYYVRFIDPNNLTEEEKKQKLTPETSKLTAAMIEENKEFDTYDLSDMFKYKTGCKDDDYLENCEECQYADQNACITLKVFGCMTGNTNEDGEEACNYNPAANVDDPTMCEYPKENETCESTCKSGYARSKNPDTNKFDGPCEKIKEGCMDNTACNYDPLANINNDNCTYPSPNANCEGECDSGYTKVNGNCVSIVKGCMNQDACNFNPLANVNDDSCELPPENEDCEGECKSGYARSKNPDTNLFDGPCEKIKEGCMDNTACNYDPLANVNNDNCTYPKTNETCQAECKSGYTRVNGNCVSIVDGCMNQDACNFNPLANVNNDSCELPKENENCEGECKSGYTRGKNPDTNLFDGPCELIKEGCMEKEACNYDPSANIYNQELCEFPSQNANCEGECKSGFTKVNGSCVTIVEGCMDPNYLEYSESANVEKENSCVYRKFPNNKIY